MPEVMIAFNQTNQDEEILTLTQEALNLASAACHFDNSGHFVGACDYYDKCLLNIDEVLNKLSPDSEEWISLLEIRSKYDDRMEFLREIETNRLNHSHMTGLSLGSSAAQVASNTMKFNRKRKQKLCQTNFDDLVTSRREMEEIPGVKAAIPFWQLRNIKITIESGGYLTKCIFIPKKIWRQHDCRLSGMAPKTTAYQFVVNLLTEHVESLYLLPDDTSLDLALNAFRLIEHSFLILQNHLSKPFPYIKEVSVEKSTVSSQSNLAAFLESSSASEAMLTSTGGLGVIPGQKLDTISSIPSSAPLPSTGGGGVTGTGSLTASSSNNRSFTNIMSSIGKNVKKYAEVGYQRFVVAMPTKLSSEELIEYSALIVRVCDKVQLLDKWYSYASELNNSTSFTHSQFQLVSGSTSQPPDQITDDNLSIRVVESELFQEEVTALTPETRTRIESILSVLESISNSLKLVVCEMINRDLEVLIDRYLTNMRKAFSRMYWDDDFGDGSGSTE